MVTVIRLPDLDGSYEGIRLENQMAGSKHVMLDPGGNPIGRVHTMAVPSLQVDTGDLAFRFDVVARGAPLGPGFDGAEKFLNTAVSAVNAVFLASVTQAGRQFWGEKHGE